MKKDIRFAICLVVIFLLAILCVYKLLAEKESEAENNTGGYELTVIPTPRTIVDPVDGKERTVIEFYKINLRKMETVSAETAIEGGTEITPNLICDCVCEALEDEELKIVVRKTSISKGVCTVDLDEEIKSVSESDPQVEKLILDAFSMSILDNCKDIEAVSFTIMGEEYSTKNIKIESDKTYIKR